MHLSHGLIDRQQLVLAAYRLGQRVLHGRGKVGDCPVDAEAQLAGGQATGQRVDGHQAARVDGRQVAALVLGVIENQ